MERKEFLKKFALAGVVATILPVAESCKKKSNSNCSETDAETAGPFPTINPSTLVLQDITDGKTGTKLTIKITIYNINNNCAVLEGAIVDIWHCDTKGEYSQYGGADNPMQPEDHKSEDFLRGRQTTNANGLVGFTSIYPGWYSGRAPHIHVHIYNSSGTSLLITQIAFPETISSTVYAQGEYASNGQADTSNASDNVFNDSIANELATVTGNTTDGYELTHSIYVKA